MAEHYKFFTHTACEYFPCHDGVDPHEFNCLFCYCPLYALGEHCGGNVTYVGEHHDIKDCSACTVPHRRENYDYILSKYSELKDLAAPDPE